MKMETETLTATATAAAAADATAAKRNLSSTFFLLRAAQLSRPNLAQWDDC